MALDWLIVYCSGTTLTSIILFYNNFIHSYRSYGAHFYYSLFAASATKPLYNLQKLTLGQVCKPFQVCESFKIISNAWVARKTNVYLYHSFSLISLLSVHMLSKQDNAHLTLQIALCHLPLKPRTTNINYPALTSTYIPFFTIAILA